MARTDRSLRITDAYQRTLIDLQRRAGAAVAAAWQRTVSLDDLDGTHPAWTRAAAAMLTTLQTAGARLTSGYLTAFIASELARPVAPITIHDSHAGTARTGKPLDEALVPTVITVKQAIAAGKPPEDAGQEGMHQATRLAAAETIAPARAVLADAIQTDERIVGWRRVTSGGCGACIAAAAHPYGAHEPMKVHDHCKCTSEPIIRDVPDLAPRATGQDIFDAMTPAEQDALLGGEKAHIIRSGQAPLSALIEVSPMTAVPDQITEAPLSALMAQTA